MARIHSKRHVVFVSHSGQDGWVAKQIAKAIEALGVEVFLDALDMEFGTDFEEEILASLKERMNWLC
jgi:TIR domain-containing protein